MKQFITNQLIKFHVWRRTRNIKDFYEVHFCIPSPSFVEGAQDDVVDPVGDPDANDSVDQEDVFIITNGAMIKQIIYVEETLRRDSRWEVDHLIAFYHALIDMDMNDDLTVPNVLMCLSPENYFQDDEEEDDTIKDITFDPA